ncbi:D-cysteine desulfhydrase family protein [Melioribacteraceae bacterium 4301-Me]|uniref:D-cysteine desulfhydrase family protein n=1 Tax=Pyranulibacter aquaticus TaxID=3163344 RepID=UPI00359A68BD
MRIKKLHRINLGFFPTPIHELKRLSNFLGGPKIFIKRDDLTGLALGGNKTRKLEFLIADAISKNCDTVITGGAEQSNHCRQTAAACALSGLKCHLVLGGNKPKTYEGNLLMNYLLGAEIHWSGKFRKGEKIPEIVDKLIREGNKPYVVPYGGSNAIGAAAFVYAINELKQQQKKFNYKFDYIIFPSSSGGTHAGLIVGKKVFNLDTKIIGIGIDKEKIENELLETRILNLANEIANLLNLHIKFASDDVIVNHDYEGKGYGVINNLEIEAIKLTAKYEGIILDPIYTGRAMGGLINIIRDKEISPTSNVLFWHTGGIPSVFAHSKSLVQ